MTQVLDMARCGRSVRAAADRDDSQRVVRHLCHGLLMRRFAATAAAVASAILALTGCGASSRDTASAPPAGASASVVLDTYLRALVAGDCATAHAAAASTFSADQGDLCGDVDVSAFSVREGPATPGPDEVIYATVLTTNGSSDGTIARGKTDWFYQLERQGGEWRVASGGTGP